MDKGFHLREGIDDMSQENKIVSMHQIKDLKTTLKTKEGLFTAIITALKKIRQDR